MIGLPATIDWYFPLPRPHTGVPLGNGTQGILVWGGDSLLLTIACAGFWDHRNGVDMPAGTTYGAVRSALETGDDAALEGLFPKRTPGAPYPQQYGGGRLEIVFPGGLRPIRATLDPAVAVVEVIVARDEDDASPSRLWIHQDAGGDVCWIEGDGALLAGLNIRLRPAYELVYGNAMSVLGIDPPEKWEELCGGGFVQSLPADPPLTIAWRLRKDRVLLASARGSTARQDVLECLDNFDVESAKRDNLVYWKNYWEGAARVELPDKVLQRQFDYGLYRQAGLIRKRAPAATLQGPWMEDTRIPPWSNDYHFNINVQLVYSAALATGQAAEMQPLWDMLRAWLPRFRALGEGFYGIKGAMLLPHAVDDRCRMMGSFWAGAIDQACIAWMARMSYQYYLHTGDIGFLREVSWPLLEGAFLGYLAALESVVDEDGKRRYSLPVSVSPEFGGSDRHKCWGRDASFQLAALHSTLQILKQAAPLLGREQDPRWDEVSQCLPEYALADANTGSYKKLGHPLKRIALWEGRDLPESHRHHSHLASIYPFCTIDPFAPAHRKIVAQSLHHWNRLGAGMWTGWCLPWASILCSRCHLPDAAVTWLHLLAGAFTNEGHATLHNADGAGVFSIDDGSLASADHRKDKSWLHWEIMQMDAAMGAVTAVLELLVSFRDGVIHLADRLPKGWRDLSFERVRLEGGFIVDGVYRHGRVEAVDVLSTRGGELRMAHALEEGWTIGGERGMGVVLATHMGKGQIIRLRRGTPGQSAGV